MMQMAILAALIGAGAAQTGARQQATVLYSCDPNVARFQQEWGYSDAVIVGDTIYLSGVVAGTRDGDAGPAEAYDRAYRRIRDILTRAGASWDDVVDMTSYHTDIATQFEPMLEVHRRYVTAPFPAWTAIGIDRLIPERGIAEIKVVARRAGTGPVSDPACPSANP